MKSNQRREDGGEKRVEMTQSNRRREDGEKREGRKKIGSAHPDTRLRK